MSNNTVNLIFGSGGGGSGNVTFVQLTGASGHLQDQIDAFGSTGVAVTFTDLQHTSGILKSGFYYVNVKDFGALGDGATDDSTAINSALTSYGRTVFFPKGNYLVSSVLNINGDMRLLGESFADTFVTCGNTTTDLFKIASGGTIEFNNLILQTNVTKTAGALVNHTGSSALMLIDDCRLIGGYDSVILRGITTTRFTRSRFQNFSHYGIQLLSGASVNTRFSLANCGITNGTSDKTGVRIESLTYALFDQNSVALPGTNGRFISSPNPVTGVYIGDNYYENTATPYDIANSGGFFFPIYSGDYATTTYVNNMSGIISGFVTGYVAAHGGTGGGGSGAALVNVIDESGALLYLSAGGAGGVTSSGVSVNWDSGVLYDQYGIAALGWKAARLALDFGGSLSVDWGGRNLYGNWKTPNGQSDITDPTSITTVAFAGGNIWTSDGTGFTVNNSTTEFSVLTGDAGQITGLPGQASLTIDPALWVAGRKFRIRVVGGFYTDATDVPNFHFGLKFNGSGFGGSEANDIAVGHNFNDAASQLEMEAEIVCLQNGAAGQVYTNGFMAWQNSLNSMDRWNFYQAAPYIDFGVQPITVDLTVPITLDYTFLMTNNPLTSNGIVIYSSNVRMVA